MKINEKKFFPTVWVPKDFSFLYDLGWIEDLKNVFKNSIKMHEVASILTWSFQENSFKPQNLGSGWEFLSSLFCCDLPIHRASFEEKMVDVIGQLADLTILGENRPKINIGHNFFLRTPKYQVIYINLHHFWCRFSWWP